MLTIYCENNDRKSICKKGICCCECGIKCDKRCTKTLLDECHDFIDDVD